MVTLATIVTLIRLILIPFIVRAILMREWAYAFILFAVASVTDILDGYIARLFNQQSDLGAAIDPIADKCLITSTLTGLWWVNVSTLHIPAWFVLFVYIKELMLIFGVIGIYVCTNKLYIKPTQLGKTAMFVQICFVLWILSCNVFHWIPKKTYCTFLALILVLVIFSLFQYSYKAIGYLLNVKNLV